MKSAPPTRNQKLAARATVALLAGLFITSVASSAVKGDRRSKSWRNGIALSGMRPEMMMAAEAADFDAALEASAPAARRRADAEVAAVEPAPLPAHRAGLYGAPVAEALAAVGVTTQKARGASGAFAAAVAARRAPRADLAPFAACRSVVLTSDDDRDRDVVAAAVLAVVREQGASIADVGYPALLRDAANLGLPADAAVAARCRDARRACRPGPE